MTNMDAMKANLDQYLDVAHKGVEYLLGIQNEDGSIKPAEKGALGYYKVPRALQIAGHITEANRMLDWVKRTIFTPEGDFTGTRAGFHKYHYTYSSAWYIWVAHFLSRFDVSYLGMDYLQKFRNSNTGGYCADGIFCDGNVGEQDLLAIAFNSFVGMHMGEIDQAKRAAELIGSIVQQQPELEENFWVRVDKQGKLVTKVDKECEDPRFYVIRTKEPQQYYYYLGAAMIFLAKLVAVTGEKRYLATAESIFNYMTTCHEDAFGSYASGKFGLASAYLYKVTKDKKYAQTAIQIADWLVEVQAQDGSWAGASASTTAEMATWLIEIVAVLNNEDGASAI